MTVETFTAQQRTEFNTPERFPISDLEKRMLKAAKRRAAVTVTTAAAPDVPVVGVLTFWPIEARSESGPRRKHPRIISTAGMHLRVFPGDTILLVETGEQVTM